MNTASPERQMTVTQDSSMIVNIKLMQGAGEMLGGWEYWLLFLRTWVQVLIPAPTMAAPNHRQVQSQRIGHALLASMGTRCVTAQTYVQAKSKNPYSPCLEKTNLIIISSRVARGVRWRGMSWWDVEGFLHLHSCSRWWGLGICDDWS